MTGKREDDILKVMKELFKALKKLDPFPILTRKLKSFLARERNFYLFYAVLAIVVGVGLYYWAGKSAQTTLTKQISLREQTLGKLAAKRIQDFFIEREDKLIMLAGMPAIEDLNSPYLKESLEEVLVGARYGVADYFRVDPQGQVILRSSGNLDIVNIADRDYFAWSKEPGNKGKVFYTDIIVSGGGLQKGQSIFIMASPTWNGNNYTGLLAISLDISEIAKEFTEELSFGEVAGTSSFLLDRSGWFLASSYPQLIGINLFDYISQYRWKGSDKLAFEAKDVSAFPREKFLEYTFRLPSSGQVVDKIAALEPIELAKGKFTWILGIAILKDEVFAFASKQFLVQTVILSICILLMVGFCLLAITQSRKSSVKAYLTGLNDSSKSQEKKVNK